MSHTLSYDGKYWALKTPLAASPYENVSAYASLFGAYTKLVYKRVRTGPWSAWKYLKLITVFSRPWNPWKTAVFWSKCLKVLEFPLDYKSYNLLQSSVKISVEGFYQIHSVPYLWHSQFCGALLLSLKIKNKWSWKNFIWCWKVLEKSLIFMSSFLYEPWYNYLDVFEKLLIRRVKRRKIRSSDRPINKFSCIKSCWSWGHASVNKFHYGTAEFLFA